MSAADTRPPEPAPARPAGVAAAWLGVPVWIAIGLAVRVWWASRESLAVGEWSARGFVQAWHPTTLADWNRFTPPLAGWLLSRIHEARQLVEVLDVRLAALGLSLAALLMACLLAALLARSTRLPQRSLGRGLCWIAAVWALHPSLVATSVEPTNDGLLGGALCLALCGPALALAGHGMAGWVFLAAGSLAALLAGGVAVALALLVGLIVFLVPIPRLGQWLGVASALLVALALSWQLQGLGAEGRLATPDAAPAASLSALMQVEVPGGRELPVHPDVRVREAYSDVAAAYGRADIGHLLAAAFERVLLEQLAPLRFDDLGAWAWPVGLLDLFLRGGALLFAVAVLGRLKPRQDSAWPRAGLAVALVLLALSRAVAGLGPWAWAPVDLVLLGVAGAGATGSRPDRQGTRWLAFAAGGLVACSLAIAPALSDRAPSPWTRDLGHPASPGADLVRLLAGGGPTDAAGHVAVAELCMHPQLPSLRMPEVAWQHASRALELSPADDAATGALLRAYVENLRLDEAVSLGEGWHPEDPAWTVRARIMPGWAREQSRKLRLELDD